MAHAIDFRHDIRYKNKYSEKEGGSALPPKKFQRSVGGP